MLITNRQSSKTTTYPFKDFLEGSVVFVTEVPHGVIVFHSFTEGKVIEFLPNGVPQLRDVFEDPSRGCVGVGDICDVGVLLKVEQTCLLKQDEIREVVGGVRQRGEKRQEEMT